MDPGASGHSGVLVDGATVAMHEAASFEDASAIAGLLVQAGVPAEVEAVRPGVVDGAWLVVVPWDRQGEADGLLERLEVMVMPRFRVGAGLDVARGREVAIPSDEAVEAEEGAPELELPDSGPVLPRMIVALSAIAFGSGLQRALSIWLGPDAAIQALAASSAHAGEWWRLVSAGFAHFGVTHQLSNAVIGLVLGVVLLGTHRAGAVMLTWLVASAIGVGAQMFGSPETSWIAGASAGNYGLVGLWAKGQIERAQHAHLPRRERLRTLGVLLLLVPGALTPVTSTGARVAVIAHAAGFVAGFVCGYVFQRRLLPEAFLRVEQRARVALWIALSIVAISLFMAGQAALATGGLLG
ncbi:MAG: rhomboid family intramembrane serine protease [Deltaproteobacteria bacterium]|nr:rhomboid family intramembrane serine protease [Deltaproteobacteria bacterium]